MSATAHQRRRREAADRKRQQEEGLAAIKQSWLEIKADIGKVEKWTKPNREQAEKEIEAVVQAASDKFGEDKANLDAMIQDQETADLARLHGFEPSEILQALIDGQ